MNLLSKLMLRSGVAEAVETFLLNLSSPTNATILDAQGVCTIQANPVITPSFTMSRTTGVAPLSVHFDATATTCEAAVSTLPFHELHYAWSFGDTAGGATWGWGTRAGVASKNTAYGAVAAHCFETAGTYTATLWVYHIQSNGLLVSASVAGSTSITVTAPDTVYSGANTICVGNGILPVAGSGGAPTGATCYNQSDWATVVGYAAGGKRVLLKRGDTWNTASAGAVSGSGGTFGAFGTGAKPIVNMVPNAQGLYFQSGRNDWRVMDIRFVSTETGTTQGENNLRIPVDTILANDITLLRVETNNTYMAWQVQLSDRFCTFDGDYSDTFPTYGGMVAFVYLGHQAKVVGNRFSRSYTTHVLRLSGTSHAVVSHNQLDTPGATRDALTVRGWEAPTPFTQYVIASDNIIDGGAVGGYVVYAGPVNTLTNEELRDVILERNTIKGGGAEGEVSVVTGVAQNFTMRNNLVQTYFESCFGNKNANGAGAPGPTSSYIYNNTFWKPDTSLTFRFSAFNIAGAATGFVIKNNLAYAPGNTQDANQAGTAAKFISYVGGATSAQVTLANNSGDSDVNYTRPWAATSPVLPADFTPNGDGVNGGTFVHAFTDYTLTQISGVRDIGAIQA